MRKSFQAKHSRGYLDHTNIIPYHYIGLDVIHLNDGGVRVLAKNLINHLKVAAPSTTERIRQDDELPVAEKKHPPTIPDLYSDVVKNPVKNNNFSWVHQLPALCFPRSSILQFSNCFNWEQGKLQIQPNTTMPSM